MGDVRGTVLSSVLFFQDPLFAPQGQGGGERSWGTKRLREGEAAGFRLWGHSLSSLPSSGLTYL